MMVPLREVTLLGAKVQMLLLTHWGVYHTKGKHGTCILKEYCQTLTSSSNSDFFSITEHCTLHTQQTKDDISKAEATHPKQYTIVSNDYAGIVGVFNPSQNKCILDKGLLKKKRNIGLGSTTLKTNKYSLHRELNVSTSIQVSWIQ